jgi:hypothetical protein
MGRIVQLVEREVFYEAFFCMTNQAYSPTRNTVLARYKVGGNFTALILNRRHELT